VNNHIEISRKHLPKLQQVLRCCHVRHGPFQRVDNRYLIPIKENNNVLILLLSMSDTDIKIVDNN
jgi:hypothetical protein